MLPVVHGRLEPRPPVSTEVAPPPPCAAAPPTESELKTAAEQRSETFRKQEEYATMALALAAPITLATLPYWTGDSWNERDPRPILDAADDTAPEQHAPIAPGCVRHAWDVLIAWSFPGSPVSGIPILGSLAKGSLGMPLKCSLATGIPARDPWAMLFNCIYPFPGQMSVNRV